MKNLLNLNGAQQLSKQEQKSVNGGHNCTNPSGACFRQCRGCNMGTMGPSGECHCF
jgi:hypothetical protein